MRFVAMSLIGSLLMMGSMCAHAQGATPPVGNGDQAAPPAPGQQPAGVAGEKPAEKTEKNEAAAKDDPWSNLGFAAGIGVNFFSKDDIRDATVRNGVVRVTETRSEERAIWLESHYQLWKSPTDRYGFGPFVAMQINDDDSGLFDSLGAGVMWSMNRAPKSKSFQNLGFNVGVGVTSTSIKRLGAGLKENEALPAGEEAVFFRKEDDTGWMVLFSFTFLSGATAEAAENAGPSGLHADINVRDNQPTAAEIERQRQVREQQARDRAAQAIPPPPPPSN